MGRAFDELFVEFIPLEQTRNYVRRVLTSLARYHYLYEGDIEPAVEILARMPLPRFRKEPSF